MAGALFTAAEILFVNGIEFPSKIHQPDKNLWTPVELQVDYFENDCFNILLTVCFKSAITKNTKIRLLWS